jgi:PPOX class probable F420-dependent enzyme
MDEQVRAFIEKNSAAAMTTLRRDGTPHSVRIGIGLMDGKLWSSSTQTRVRTKHLRRDPRSTLLVFDPQWLYLTLECNAIILDGPDAPDMNLRFMKMMQAKQDMPVEAGKVSWFGRQLTEEQFLETMVQEQRLIYEFDVVRHYGLYAGMSSSS